MNVSIAVSRKKAVLFGVNKDENKDKRNLYLADEGLIADGTDAAMGLSTKEITKRRMSQKEKKMKLRNPNFAVSKFRLSVRNLPREMDDVALKSLFFKAAQNNLHLGQPDEKLIDRNVVIKQAKVICDKIKLTKEGRPRSREFGFVEFVAHDHALAALRFLNNNGSILGKQMKKMSGGRRLIVEFSLDDNRKMLKMKQRIEMNEKLKAQRIEGEKIWAERQKEQGLIQAGDNKVKELVTTKKRKRKSRKKKKKNESKDELPKSEDKIYDPSTINRLSKKKKLKRIRVNNHTKKKSTNKKTNH